MLYCIEFQQNRSLTFMDCRDKWFDSSYEEISAPEVILRVKMRGEIVKVFQFEERFELVNKISFNHKEHKGYTKGTR